MPVYMRINSFFLKRHFWLETTSSHLEDNKKIWRMEYKGIALSSKWNWKHNLCLNQRNVKTALWCLGLLLMWPEHQSEPGKWQNDRPKGTHRSRTSNQTRVAKQEKNSYASGSVQENLERLIESWWQGHREGVPRATVQDMFLKASSDAPI